MSKMKLKERIYMDSARILPKFYKSHFREIFDYSGEKGNSDLWLGSTTLLAFFIFVIVNLLSWNLYGGFTAVYVIGAAILFFLVELVSYMIMYLKMVDRTKRVEKVLPDALQLIAADLRSGMTPFQALRLSARKEFGPLSEEIRYATSRALGTESFSETLMRISGRIKSDLLDRSIRLFVTSMKSGGRVAQLLEELSRDIAERNSLKRDLATSTKTYIMFILFTIIFGTPLLFAISIRFIEVLSGIQAKAGITTAGFGMSFLAGQISITPEYLTKIAVVSLVVTALLASMLISIISEGNPKYGLKYSPFIMGGSLLMFVISRYLIAVFFKSIV